MAHRQRRMSACWRLTLITLLLLGLTSMAWGGLRESLDAYYRGESLTAYEGFFVLAQAGNPIAQYHVGWMISMGQSKQWDERTAQQWYHKALSGLLPLAQHGNAQAQWYLGMMYEQGLIVP